MIYRPKVLLLCNCCLLSTVGFLTTSTRVDEFSELFTLTLGVVSGVLDVPVMVEIDFVSGTADGM